MTILKKSNIPDDILVLFMAFGIAHRHTHNTALVFKGHLPG